MQTSQADRCIKQYQAHTLVNKIPGTHITMIGNNLCDIFSGTGWETPSRYRLMTGRWCYVSGPRLDVLALSHLPTRIVRK